MMKEVEVSFNCWYTVKVDADLSKPYAEMNRLEKHELLQSLYELASENLPSEVSDINDWDVWGLDDE